MSNKPYFLDFFAHLTFIHVNPNTIVTLSRKIINLSRIQRSSDPYFPSSPRCVSRVEGLLAFCGIGVAIEFGEKTSILIWLFPTSASLRYLYRVILEIPMILQICITGCTLSLYSWSASFLLSQSNALGRPPIFSRAFAAANPA